MTSGILDNVYVIVPALNEEGRIDKLIWKLLETGFSKIIVVDDGSTDRTIQSIPDIEGISVLSHAINLGPGASTMTGVRYGLAQGAEYIATIDADLQHDPNDLLFLYEAISTSNSELVIGSRFKQVNQIPLLRRMYNMVGNIISFLKTGMVLTDSQSGLKIMTRAFAEKLNIEYNGFEFCIDIIRKANLQGLSVNEEPISVKYTEESMAKGQSFLNGVKMLGRLFNPFHK